jgi:hypothetical protein
MTHKEKVEATIGRHIIELRELAAERKISEQDHDLVGGILCQHIAHLIELSPTAWEKFVSIVNESRNVHYATPVCETCSMPMPCHCPDGGRAL